MWSWGNNDEGQLGLGDATDRSNPVQIGALTTWSNVTAGPRHVLAIKTDGTLWGHGGNGNGQVGDSTTTNRSSPVQIGALTKWLSVAAGSYFSHAISN
jgi:alpha-tubulin suppressor-like RCC1 family protein